MQATKFLRTCLYIIYFSCIIYGSWHLFKPETEYLYNQKKLETLKEYVKLFIFRKYTGPTISFCTTYRDRFEQISQTLPQNLANNRMDKDNIEFVLIDFDPSDTRLKEFIFKNFSQDISSGYLKYYQTDQMPVWNFSIAKNTAHYYATNEVVVNLDADNYTGYRGGQYVANIFANSTNAFLWQNQNEFAGTYGRISLYKKDFDYLGGYDETLPAPAGYQDDDLIKRAESFLKVIHKDFFNESIINSKEETIKHTQKNISWFEMVKINQAHSDKNIKKRKFRANNGIYGIRNGVNRIMSYEGNI